MKSVSLTVFPRAQVKRSGVKKLRAKQRVPAVMYGRDKTPQNLEIVLHEIEKLIHHSVSENILLDLNIEGDKKPKRLALIQDIQHHPLTRNILHIDLHEVEENERVVVTVPVEAIGESIGVREGGGILEHILHSIKVRALPKNLPEVVRVDVSALQIGQVVHLGDLKLVDGVEVIGDKKTTVISVAEPISEAAEAAAVATPVEGAAAEPEVLREKKDEEEGAAPAGKDGEKGKAAAPKAAAPADKKAEKGADKKK